MPSNYKRLGDYIHKVENRNRDLKVSKLVGLSMTKEFRVSTSNIVGTDMSVYKVVNKWQFSCDFMSVIRVHKFPVVLKTDDDPVLVSPAYTVFEVNDENELNPEYLMMWFRRSEFDRYADFKCDSAIRGGFDWDALCDCMLPIPSIEKQQEIVKEYNTIQNRIALNNQLISKLEETAQAIYKQWFVDFEFPFVTSSGVEMPYKSNGGKMVWCEELEKEIPEGWEVGNFQKDLIFKTGKLDSNASIENGKYPFFTCSEEVFKVDSFAFDQEAVLLGGNNATGKFPLKYFKGKFDAYQRTYVISSNNKRISNKQIFYRIKGLLDEMRESSVGTATKFLTMQIFNPITIIIPNVNINENFENIIQKIYTSKQLYFNQNQKLEELKDLLLAKMTRVEN
ncbi:restriction endonuclease subunit S [Flavobacterium psychraquaticum]|uniref:restriction endonuclease subunit S n=1 Tax=Flavobacterium psychraquaticum TaxID=3103958 RepID=UPI002ACDDAEB|nr:restriction endonuclease subunit S [Flavobacterium sp. LB-N7T]